MVACWWCVPYLHHIFCISTYLSADSVTENQFFSLSCLLWPHVIATPDYTKGSFDRAWPQHLYLNPASPLLEDDAHVLITGHRAGQEARRRIELPEGFDIAKTPLVSFRRIDLLFSPKEIETMHRELHPEYYQANASFKLYGTKAVWSSSPEDYLDVFTQDVPLGRYRTMVVSTAGHWTLELFKGYDVEGANTENGGPVYGYDGLLTFFREAMEKWVGIVQKRLDEANVKLDSAGASAGSWKGYPPSRVMGQPKERKMEVVVRAYLPGHEDCHSHREAWTSILPFQRNLYNWHLIDKYNEVFEVGTFTPFLLQEDGIDQPLIQKLLMPATTKTSNIHYLPIDRPGRLRPDAVRFPLSQIVPYPFSRRL